MGNTATFFASVGQHISFHDRFMKLDMDSRALFWPGCSLMKLDPSILRATLAVLRRAEPDMGLSCCCCGEPSRYAFPERYEERREKLRELLMDSACTRIYTPCPCCKEQLEDLGCAADVHLIWELLESCILPGDIHNDTAPDSCHMHDPCLMSETPEDFDTLRRLASLAGVSVKEPQHTRERSLCCGRFHGMRLIDPQRSAIMRQRRLTEFPHGAAIASSCENCLCSLSGVGHSEIHVLELLFGKSARRSLFNRLRYTFTAASGAGAGPNREA